MNSCTCRRHRWWELWTRRTHSPSTSPQSACRAARARPGCVPTVTRRLARGPRRLNELACVRRHRWWELWTSQPTANTYALPRVIQDNSLQGASMATCVLSADMDTDLPDHRLQLRPPASAPTWSKSRCSQRVHAHVTRSVRARIVSADGRRRTVRGNGYRPSGFIARSFADVSAHLVHARRFSAYTRTWPALEPAPSLPKAPIATRTIRRHGYRLDFVVRSLAGRTCQHLPGPSPNRAQP